MPKFHVRAAAAHQQKKSPPKKINSYKLLDIWDGAQSLGLTPGQTLPHLSEREQEFFRFVRDGDISGLSVFIQTHTGFRVNCLDICGKSALDVAVLSEDKEVVVWLLQLRDIQINDALLHACRTGSPDIVSLLLDKLGTSKSYIASEDLQPSLYSPEFTADLTPLKVAAHYHHYHVIQLLLSRGFKLYKPHPPTCFCEKRCAQRKKGELLEDSMARYNAYRAVSSPEYIMQAYPDPILSAFHLSQELVKCSQIEREFKEQYLQLSEDCSQFAVSLLAQCRTTEEVSTLLHRTSKAPDTAVSYNSRRFPRGSMAVDFNQKAFIAHTHCQQVLRATWLEGWHDWQSLSFFTKLLYLLPRTVFLPIMAVLYWMLPGSKFVKSWASPINKFFSFAASYIMFLSVVIVQNALDINNSLRGPPSTGLEIVIVLYVAGMTWHNFKTLVQGGLTHYLKQLWNVYDAVMLCMFTSAIICWSLSYFDILAHGAADLPRNVWGQYDWTLIAEALYSIAIIFAFGRMLFFFQIGHSLGPLQVSLGSMMLNIAHFMALYLLVLTSFSVGLHNIYHHYTGQVRIVDGTEVKQTKAFESITQTVGTLYWAIYGYSPPNFADVIVSYNEHRLTEIIGHAMFALYYITGVIIMFNMLIAMMSTTFSEIQENADVEWKFARTKIWMMYFESGSTLPPPFNLVPSPKTFYLMIVWAFRSCRGQPSARCSGRRCCYLESYDEVEGDNDEQYQEVMANLVQRFLTSHSSSLPSSNYNSDPQTPQPGQEMDLSAIKHAVSSFKRSMLTTAQRSGTSPQAMGSHFSPQSVMSLHSAPQ